MTAKTCSVTAADTPSCKATFQTWDVRFEVADKRVGPAIMLKKKRKKNPLGGDIGGVIAAPGVYEPPNPQLKCFLWGLLQVEPFIDKALYLLCQLDTAIKISHLQLKMNSFYSGSNTYGPRQT